MAKKSGNLGGRILNFIGLKEEEPERNTRSDDYDSEKYGRQSTYVPSRQRTSANSDRRSSTSTSTRRSIPAQASRSNYDSRSSYDSRRPYDDTGSRYSSSSRRPSRFEEDYDRDYEAPRPSTRSRFEEDDGDMPQNMPVPASRPAPRGSNRTVLFSLKNLRDANMVITALVKGNTIVMTLDTDDPHVVERIVDTLSGAVFALGATIRKASAQTYVLAPRTSNVKTAYEVEDQF